MLISKWTGNQISRPAVNSGYLLWCWKTQRQVKDGGEWPHPNNYTFINIKIYIKRWQDKENITVWLDEFKQPLLCVKRVLYTVYIKCDVFYVIVADAVLWEMVVIKQHSHAFIYWHPSVNLKIHQKHTWPEWDLSSLLICAIVCRRSQTSCHWTNWANTEVNSAKHHPYRILLPSGWVFCFELTQTEDFTYAIE